MDKWKGCGISTIWGLKEDHPFNEACLKHDAFYDDDQGLPPERIDRIFLHEMLDVATTPWLKLQARLFYGFARLWRLKK